MSWFTEKQSRLVAANKLIFTIATCGRRFLSYTDDNGVTRISYLKRDDNNRLWFFDAFNAKNVYVSARHRWRGFSSGGTMKWLVIELVDFIRTGEQLTTNLFDRNWAYGDDMVRVVSVGRELGVICE